MLHKLIAIYDSKSETYMRPATAKTKGEALRSFITEANNSKSKLNMYPEDFSLWIIGEFDDSSGQIIPLKHHENLGKAQEFIEHVPVNKPVENVQQITQ